MLEPEPAEGEEEEEGGEVEDDQAMGEAEEEGEEEHHPSVSEENQELPESLKPKMKLFSGNLAAGLRIRAEPSFLVSEKVMCVYMWIYIGKHVQCVCMHLMSLDMCADNNYYYAYFSQFQATSVGIIKPGESFTYTDEVHISCGPYIRDINCIIL